MDREPRHLLSRLLEAACIFALSAFLIKLGICYLHQVRWALIILAVLGIAGYIVFRILKNRHDTKW